MSSPTSSSLIFLILGLNFNHLIAPCIPHSLRFPSATPSIIPLNRSLLTSRISLWVALNFLVTNNKFREGKSDKKKVMKQNEKILTKAFPRLLKHAQKMQKLKKKQVLSGLHLAMCELMVYRLRDVGADAPDTYVHAHINRNATLQ